MRRLDQTLALIEVKRHSPNVTLGSVLAVQKLDFGINPNVQYSLYLGLIPIWWKRGFWDQSQCLVQSVFGIDPNVMENKALGQIPELSILGFWDKSQNFQRKNSGIGGLTTIVCFLSVPILPKTLFWDKSQPFQYQDYSCVFSCRTHFQNCHGFSHFNIWTNWC